ncbi:MAG: hypothetical protein KME27_18665 [Lyngbya sp. HA4199-MV5]|jgi:hypothetical protein|nr:hypothetical protein [Lyngbya sp. HA4199-MV5]
MMILVIMGKGVLTIARCASFLVLTFSTVPLLRAQNAPTLTERIDQIDTCRGTTTPLTIYTTSTLSGAIGTVLENSSVTLTGIFGTGTVQIKAPQLGWVATNTLISNCGGAPDGGLPVDIDTNPQYCRRLRSVERDGAAYADLQTGLVARNTPNGTFQYVDTSNQTDGPTKAAVVRFSGRVADLQDAGGRRWIRVKYIGMAGSPRVGWVPNGSEGVNRNIAACASGQN